MAAGQLRHRIDLVRPSAVADGEGGSLDVDAVIVSFWPAAIDPAPPAWRVSQIVGGAVTDRVWLVALIRYVPNVDAGAVLIWRGKRWVVRGVRDPFARGVWLEVAAEALV